MNTLGMVRVRAVAYKLVDVHYRLVAVRKPLLSFKAAYSSPCNNSIPIFMSARRSAWLSTSRSTMRGPW